MGGAGRIELAPLSAPRDGLNSWPARRTSRASVWILELTSTRGSRPIRAMTRCAGCRCRQRAGAAVEARRSTRWPR